jgi:hypothetical protein
MLPLLDRWRAAIETVKVTLRRQGTSLAYARVIAIRPGEIAILFPPGAAFQRSTVMGATKPQVEAALSEHFGRPTKLVEETSATEVPLSIAEEEAQGRRTRERDIDSKVKAHPAVRSALRILGGELEHVRVLEPEARPAPPPSAAEDAEL